MFSQRLSILAGLVLIAGTIFAAPATATESTTVVSHIKREPISSSGLAAVGYSKRRHILEIKFVNGAVYRYLNVPPSIYRDLMSAVSKGRYYDSNIRGNYRSLRLRAAKSRTDD
jgi:KTSC domain